MYVSSISYQNALNMLLSMLLIMAIFMRGQK
jgi:hypothetical protein